MQKLFSFLVMALLIASCAQPTEEAEEPEKAIEPVLLDSDTHRAFYANLSQLCGKSFQGEEIYRSHHGESVADQELIMQVVACTNEYIYIPFHIGDDKSRTWMFLVEDGKLRLSHDHRDEDGKPHEVTEYGGYADDTGSEYVQHFPADEDSAEMIEDGGGNVWTIKLDEDLTTFTYRLERDGEKRWRVDFNLRQPL